MDMETESALWEYHQQQAAELRACCLRALWWGTLAILALVLIGALLLAGVGT